MISPNLAISSRRILACRDTLAAGLLTQPAGVIEDDHRETLGPAPLPAGVKARVLASHPAYATPIRALDIEGLHDTAMGMAWRDGAWDLRVDLIPPLAGPELGLVSAFVDYSADPGLEAILLDAASRGRLATWAWRPMRDGPATRQRLHGAADLTLGPDLGRTGEPPAQRRPDFGRCGGRKWVIRLALDETRAGPRPRPATVNQRGYLARLLRQAGQADRLPARLTFDQASAWIDQLKAGRSA
jgi:hypothetical protein